MSLWLTHPMGWISVAAFNREACIRPGLTLDIAKLGTLAHTLAVYQQPTRTRSPGVSTPHISDYSAPPGG